MFRDSLTSLAWLNVLLHLIALVLAALGMRPGTPLVPLAERLDYLAQAPLGWTAGWISWMCCAAALIAYLATLSRRLDEPLAHLGLTIAVAGAAFDLFCDSVYIVVFPTIAALQPPPETLFLIVERIIGIASLVIANGAYSIAILLFSLALRKRQALASLTVVIGYAVAAFGLLLAGAGFTGVPWHAEWLTGPTIGLFCVWVVLVAHSPSSAGRHM